jgi:non-specific protein-tyrosine kinase
MDDGLDREVLSFSDDLRRYISLLMQWAWLLALVTVLAAATAYLVSKRMTPVYQASTTIMINEAPSTKATDYTSILTSERLARTYTEMITKVPVLQAAIDRLELSGMEAGDLAKAVRVELVRDTQLIVVRVENTDAQLAADLANTIFTVFNEQIKELQSSRFAASKDNLEVQLKRIDEQIQQTTKDLERAKNNPAATAERDRLETALAQYRQTYASLLQSYEQVRVSEAASSSNVVQIEPATAPERPIRPRTFTNTALAGLVGLMLAIGAVFLIEALDDTIHGPEDITRTLKLPVLGLVVRHDTEDGKLITVEQPRSPVSESFRSLRTNLQFASVDKPLRTLLVTSPSPSDGKSTIAANIGVVMAQSGRRVVLVDADMRRPRVHKLLKIPNRKGMSSLFVSSKVELDGSLQKTMSENFLAIPAGDVPPNPAELLGSERMFDILMEIGKKADLIVIDSPPVIAVTDSAVLAHRVDGVLLVIKPGATKMEAARQAVEQLQRAGANILGVVLNEVDFGRSRYSYYHYKGYYYSYHYYYDESGKRVKLRSKKKQTEEDQTVTVH